MRPSLVLSAAGQADDTVLFANSLLRLYQLLQLANQYCLKFNVKLSKSKTKLLKISPPRIETLGVYNPIQIDDKLIKFSDQAEHVSVIRSVEGNKPNLIQRLSAFKKALGAVVSC